MAWIDKTDQSRVFDVPISDSQSHKSALGCWTLFIFSIYTFLWAYVVALFIAFLSDISHKTRGLCFFSFWVLLLLNLLWKNNRRRSYLVKNVSLRHTAFERDRTQRTDRGCYLGLYTIHIESHNNWVRTVSRGKTCLSLVWKWQCHQLVDHVQEQTLSNLQWVSGHLLSSLSRSSPTPLISASPYFYDRFFLPYAWRRKLQEFSEANTKSEREREMYRKWRGRQRESTKWVWKPGRRGWKKCLFAILIILSNTRKERWTVLTQTLDW